MVEGIRSVLDDRELAIAAWILAALLFALIHKKIRPSIGGVLKAASTPKVAVPLLLLLLYVAGVATGLRAAGLWTFDLISETVLWLVGTALVLFFAYERVRSDPRFFRRTILGVFSVTVLLEFVVSLYPLPLLAEFLLVPFLVMLGALLAVSVARSDLAPAKGSFEVLAVATGLGLLAYSGVSLSADPASFATIDNAREFVTPILLTVCFLPFIYAVAVYASYDSLLARLRFLLDEDDVLYRYARRRLLRTSGLRLRAVLRAARAPWMLMLSRPSDRNDVDRVITHIKSRRVNVLAMSPDADERIKRISAEKPDGWEYILFAARLEAGRSALANGSQSLDDSGRAFRRRRSSPSILRLLQEDQRTAVALMEELEQIFDQENVSEAFGARGDPGDVERIIAFAEAFLIVYDQMLQWSERARSTPTDDNLASLVQTHAALLDQPHEKIDEYINRWIELAERLPRLLEADEPVELDMPLVITVDDAVIERFKAEVARVGV